MRTSQRLIPLLTTGLLTTGLLTAGPLACGGAPGPQDPRGEEGTARLEGSLAGPGGHLAVHLPGAGFFPEGIAAASDGTLYVGGLGTGAIVRVRPHALGAQPFVEGRAAFGVYGLAVDEARGTLWACTYDDTLPPAQPARLHAYALASGELKGSYPMPGGSGFCNDVTVDGAGNVYASDSFANTLVRLPAGGGELETWATSEAFAGEPWSITLNGLTFDGQGTLYVVKSTTGELFSIPIQPDGSAGVPVAIPVEPALSMPDGLEWVDARTLLVVEHESGRVVRVKLSGGVGHQELLTNGLLQPTTAALAGDGAWVVESQFGVLYGILEAPSLPFRVHRLVLP